MDDNGAKKPETKFCHLCGKHLPLKEFTTIQLSKLGNVIIKCEGCQKCSTVVHNASVIINETVKRYLDEQPRIIKP